MPVRSIDQPFIKQALKLWTDGREWVVGIQVAARREKVAEVTGISPG
jgi:hypothetical protein